MYRISAYIRHTSIRNKLIFFMAVIIIATSLINLYFYNMAYGNMDKYKEMIQGYSEVNNMSILLIQGRDSISKYIGPSDSGGDASQLEKYKSCMVQVVSLAEKVYNESGTMNSYLLARAVNNSINSYQQEIDFALKSGSDEQYLLFLKAKEDSAYIEGYIKQLLDIKLSEGEWSHQQLTKNEKTLRMINLASVLLITIFALIYVVVLSNSVTIPIKKLTQFAKRISNNDFSIKELRLDSSEDMNLLAQTLNKMSDNIQNTMLMERRLFEEELEHVKMSSELNKARFLGLQSQINPHFLFNTLNAIARFSMFEGANKTTSLIESLSRIFRHNLDNSETVLLEDELKVIEEYAAIQCARFGSRFGLDIILKTEIRNIALPGFIIQPLVENAIMHGLESKESGGRVRIKVYKKSAQLVIKIIDNGVGMSKETIKQLLDNKGWNTQRQAHTTGIGLNNVRERMILYCKNESCFKIWSKKNLGTVIILRFKREE